MEYEGENDAASGAAPHTEFGTAPLQTDGAPPKGPKFGLPQPKRSPLLGIQKGIPVDGWKERDAFLHLCVRLGLNAPQIAKLSLSTPQPMRTHQHVYDKIREQGLAKLYDRPKTKRRRVGPHNLGLLEIFMKVYGQALEYGYEVTDVMRDESPVPGVRFRTDLGLRIGPRRFFWEYQTSKLEFTRWHAKLKQYLKLYRVLGEPFRAVFLLQDRLAVTKVRGYARDLLRQAGHPRLNLYLFSTMDEFIRERDILKSPGFLGAWEADRRYGLML